MSLGGLVEEFRLYRMILETERGKYNFDDAPLYSAKYVVEEINMGIITNNSNTLHHGKLKNQTLH